MAPLNPLLRLLGRWLARYLSRADPHFVPLATSSRDRLTATLAPCDVLLIEGNTRISTAIKYLTQSTWSHAALYLGVGPFAGRFAGEHVLIEADLNEGIRLLLLDAYAGMHTRVCRPVGLLPAHRQAIIDAALARLGHQYDLKNVIDLARYLLPTPPVPVRWRRRMLALGSGEPTKAICSTFIAQLFQGIRYPILPRVERRQWGPPDCNTCYDEVLHIRHHSLFAPRDFDISPYFAVVKPTLEDGFDFRRLVWEAAAADARAAIEAAAAVERSP
jgi:hypothetical protein